MTIEDAISSHLREVFRYVAQKSGLPVASHGSFITITHSYSDFGVNYILGAGVPQTSEDYKALLAPFVDPKLSFIWFSGPSTKNLGEKLHGHGLRHIGPLTGLSLDLENDPIPAFIYPLDLEIVPVTTTDLFQEWCDIHARTWNKSSEVTNLFFKGLQPTPHLEERCFLFLAKFRDSFVGCSLLDVQGQKAGFYWDSVLPEYRNKGLGTAMIHHRIAVAKQKGCSSVVAQCLNSSLPLYLKTGFKKYSDMALFKGTTNGDIIDQSSQ